VGPSPGPLAAPRSHRSSPRRRFWIEATIATVTGALAVLSIFWRDWIEGLTGWDPDHHSGSAESLIVVGLFAVAVAVSAAARAEWRRPQRAVLISDR
jgi:hypothetical protein